MRSIAQFRSPVFEVKQILVDLPGRDAAEREPGGELGAEIGAEEAIACVFIGRHGGSSEKIGDASVPGSLATVKGMGGDGIGGPSRGVHEAQVLGQGLC